MIGVSWAAGAPFSLAPSTRAVSSGAAVEGMAQTQGLMGAYATAWIATGLTAIPPILLVLLLARVQSRRDAAAAVQPA